MTDTHELVTWYLNILAEEERAARALDGRSWVADGHDVITDDDDGRYVVEGIDSWVATHMALQNPAAVLDDVEAKLLAVEQIQHWITKFTTHAGRTVDGATPAWVHELEHRYETVMPILRALASRYSSRPGYREEWRP